MPMPREVKWGVSLMISQLLLWLYAVLHARVAEQFEALAIIYVIMVVLILGLSVGSPFLWWVARLFQVIICVYLYGCIFTILMCPAASLTSILQDIAPFFAGVATSVVLLALLRDEVVKRHCGVDSKRKQRHDFS